MYPPHFGSGGGGGGVRQQHRRGGGGGGGNNNNNDVDESRLEQERYERQLDSVWQRVETLPFVVCKAASGESFKVRRAHRSGNVEAMLLRQLGFNEADLHTAVVEKHQPWELKPADVSGPEEWAAIRMQNGGGPEGLNTFYDEPLGNPSLTLKARRQAAIDAEAAKAPKKKNAFKGVFDRRGHNAKVKGSENRKGVNKNVLNFLDKGVAEKDEMNGLLSVAMSPRPEESLRTALYSAVLEENAEAYSEAAARSAHEEAKRAAREATDVYRNAMKFPGGPVQADEFS